MPTATQIDAPLLMMDEVLTDLVTGCDESEAVLTWAGEAYVFSVNDEGRLSWRLTNRDGSDPAIPQKAAVGIFDANDTLVDTLPVCLEPANTTNPLLWADKQWDTGGLYQARLTVQFTDGTYAAAIPVELAVKDIFGFSSSSGGGAGPGGHPGTVWSVGLDMPSPPFDVANSPITDSGVLTVTLTDEPAGTVWAAPLGADGPPSFRPIDISDLPTLTGYEQLVHKAVADGYAPLDDNALVPLVNLPPIPTTPLDTGNFLYTGGGIAWVTGYTYRVSAAKYYIQGVLYSSVEQTITLNAADPVLDRIDLLALNTSGTVVKVTGNPSATPSEPDVDPTTELQLAFVLVKAATSAPTVSTESIYAENVEWTTSISGTGWNPASTNSPRTGSLDVEGTNVANNAYVQFQRPSGPVNISAAFSILVFYIKSKAKWTGNRSLSVRLLLNGVAAGKIVAISDGAFGFGSGTTADYQQMVLPIANFTLPAGTMINQIRIIDNGGALGCYIDDVFLQDGGLQSTSTQYLTEAQADARYEQLIHRGAASGYAPLDTNSRVPAANLPPMGPSGTGHAPGIVPDPGASAGTTKFLREDGTWTSPPGGGSGTVSSVGLSAPVEFTVTGSPVTGSGTLTFAKAIQSPNLVYCGPPTGAPTAPGFRPLVPTDLPVMVGSGPSHASGTVPDPGSTAGTSRFLREDGTWQNMAAGAPNMANGQVAASGTAATLVSSRATRRFVTVKNLDSTITVYVGIATVTAANGMPLAPGESISLDFTGLVQVIAASGTPTVAYAEVYD